MKEYVNIAVALQEKKFAKKPLVSARNKEDIFRIKGCIIEDIGQDQI